MPTTLAWALINLNEERSWDVTTRHILFLVHKFIIAASCSGPTTSRYQASWRWFEVEKMPFRFPRRALVKNGSRLLQLCRALIVRGQTRYTEEYHLWFCASRIHILFAATRSSQVLRKHVFLAPHCPKTGFANNLGLNYSPYTYRGLWSRILGACIRREKIVVFLPHISLAIADRQGVQLLWLLSAMGAIRFYDDGMSAISSHTVLHQSGFLPPRALIDAWDYPWLSPNRIGSTVDLSLAHRKLASSFPEMDLPYLDLLAPPSLHAGAGLTPAMQPDILSIVLASNWIDHDFVHTELHRTGVELAEVVYIPHYNSTKNSQILMNACNVQKCFVPELFLARLFELRRCRLYFGVTSTAVYLCELMSRGELPPFEAIFVGSRRLAGANNRVDEWDDYSQIITTYLPI